MCQLTVLIIRLKNEAKLPSWPAVASPAVTNAAQALSELLKLIHPGAWRYPPLGLCCSSAWPNERLDSEYKKRRIEEDAASSEAVLAARYYCLIRRVTALVLTATTSSLLYLLPPWIHAGIPISFPYAYRSRQILPQKAKNNRDTYRVLYTCQLPAHSSQATTATTTTTTIPWT